MQGSISVNADRITASLSVTWNLNSDPDSICLAAIDTATGQRIVVMDKIIRDRQSTKRNLAVNLNHLSSNNVYRFALLPSGDNTELCEATDPQNEVLRYHAPFHAYVSWNQIVHEDGWSLFRVKVNGIMPLNSLRIRRGDYAYHLPKDPNYDDVYEFWFRIGQANDGSISTQEGIRVLGVTYNGDL